MSHTVTTKAVEMRNVPCLEKAIQELKLKNLGMQVHKLFDGTRAEGIGVMLPGWREVCVINPKDGTAKYDNYGESWGKQIELDKLVQRYSALVTEEQAIAGGYTFEKGQTFENGDVELVMTELVGC